MKSLHEERLDLAAEYATATPEEQAEIRRFVRSTPTERIAMMRELGLTAEADDYQAAVDAGRE